MAATTVPATTPVHLDLGLYPEIRRFGAADVSACFSCGTCTATCPLVEDDATFPRRLIRYAQLGMKKELLASKELWTCYHCGECTESCPTGADPAEFMASARRYAVASYEPTGVARAMALSAPVAGIVTALTAVAMAAFMLSGATGTVGSGFFGFIPAPLVHDLGIVVMALWAVAMGVGLWRMGSGVFGSAGDPGSGRPTARRILGAAWDALARESLGQVRYRRDCLDERGSGSRRWYLRRWFLHAATMWGFLGLFGATILDYLLELAGIKPTGTPVPIWYPVRLLGTIAGLALMYGTTILVSRRLRGTERSYERSSVSDWSFLSLLWLTGLTGFVIELSLYLPSAPWGDALFLVHVALAMTLVLSMPFGKFAHALYRPVALFALRLRAAPGGADR